MTGPAGRVLHHPLATVMLPPQQFETSPMTRIRIGTCTVDPTRNLLERTDQSLKLEPRAMDVLVYLAKRPGEAVSADELLREVWAGRVFDDGIVYTKINQLRKALGDDPRAPRFIETIPKRGYRLIAAVDLNGAAEAATAGANGTLSPASVVTTAAEPAALSERSPFAKQGRRWLALGASLVIAIVALILVTLWPLDDRPQLTVAGRMVNLTTEPGDETDPSLSPDGSRVAFVHASGAGRAGIYVMDIGSTQLMPLTPSSTGIERSPRWSPVKPEIAFLRQRRPAVYDLIVVPALGGEERKLATVDIGFTYIEATPLLAWTPDGRLVFNTVKDADAAVPEHALHVLSPSTGAIEELGVSAGADDYDTSPAFSADGRRMAFVRYHRQERQPQLMVQDIGPGLKPLGAPQPVPIVPPIGIVRAPNWSRDGETLTFIIDREIYEWRVGGTARVIYTAPLLALGFDMSWREQSARAVISLSAANLDIFALPLDPATHVASRGLESAVPLIQSTAGERGQKFSHDGSKLAYTSAIGGIEQVWISNTDGSEPRRITNLPWPVMAKAVWSPDDRQIAFPVADPARNLVTYLVDVEAGPPRELFEGYPTDWSEDGQFLYAFRLGNPETAIRVRVADTQIEELFHGGGIVETTEAADVLYAKANKPGIFARALAGDLASNPERMLVEDYYPARGDIVPVEGGFYYVGHSDQNTPRAFRFYDYAARTAHDVAAAPKGLDIGMTVSSDRTKLLFTAHAPGSSFDLRMLDFDTR